MNPVVMPAELELRHELLRRTIENMYDEGDWDSLFELCHLLNGAWHQQTIMARWAAEEAAANLGGDSLPTLSETDTPADDPPRSPNPFRFFEKP